MAQSTSSSASDSEPGTRSLDDIWRANQQAAEAQARMSSEEARQRLMEEVGDGGFYFLNMKVSSYLGSFNVDLQAPSALGGAAPEFMGSNSSRPKSPIFLMHSGVVSVTYPEDIKQPVLLREYLPSTVGLGVTDAIMCNTIEPMPQVDIPSKLAAAAGGGSSPFIPLLGYYWGPQSERGEVLDPDPDQGETLWLVFKPASYRPLALYPLHPQPQSLLHTLFNAAPASLLSKLPIQRPSEDKAQVQRCAMVRRICWQCINALLALHVRMVTHNKVSPAAFVGSTWDDVSVMKQKMRMDVFAFSNAFSSSLADERLIAGQRLDVQSLGLTLLEVVFSSLAAKGVADETRASAWYRLAMDVFKGDVWQLREYCLQVDGWETPTAFLDERGKAGWDLIGALLETRMSLQNLLQHPFFGDAV